MTYNLIFQFFCIEIETFEFHSKTCAAFSLDRPVITLNVIFAWDIATLTTLPLLLRWPKRNGMQNGTYSIDQTRKWQCELLVVHQRYSLYFQTILFSLVSSAFCKAAIYDCH